MHMELKNELAVVQSLSHIHLFVTPWTAACQVSLYNSWLMSIKPGMPSNYLILCCPLLLLPSILPSIRVFSNESAVHINWPKYWSFSFSISPSNEYSGLISLQSRNSPESSPTTVQKHQFFSAQASLWLNPLIQKWLIEKPELRWIFVVVSLLLIHYIGWS